MKNTDMQKRAVYRSILGTALSGWSGRKVTFVSKQANRVECVASILR